MLMSVSVPELTDRASHFDFGKNWSEFSEHITPERIAIAESSIRRLVGDITGKTFFDIGSGSGLLALAALRLGAKSVSCIDIDEDSVATTTRVLETYAPGGSWTVEQMSVFDIPASYKFDVVYSWGVLHHTGAMWRAVDRASRTVVDGGAFAFALYERTPLCGAWKVEKRLYVRAPKPLQRALCKIYETAYTLARYAIGKGRHPGTTERGFTVASGIPDWMGGYPYESTTLSEVEAIMNERGFTLRYHNPAPVHAFGIFGSGCSEYVYVRGGSRAS
jgi:2-polyprenyl-6-hydroxyphenyl methylase/3-demethylubiquinone-9 3-methyltransferase